MTPLLAILEGGCFLFQVSYYLKKETAPLTVKIRGAALIFVVVRDAPSTADIWVRL